MIIEIPADLQQFIHEIINTGQFKSEEEVVSQALRLLRKRQSRLEGLRAEIQPALDQLDRGEGIEIDSEGLDAFFEDIKAASKAELDAERKSL